ncbi:MAG: hypothetical protein GX262_01445 [Clostridia bacterium]|nr:hypothetical protein [Clostridia bacterium]
MKKYLAVLILSLFVFCIFVPSSAFGQKSDVTSIESATAAEIRVDLSAAPGNHELSESEKAERRRWIEKQYSSMRQNKDSSNEQQLKEFFSKNGLELVADDSYVQDDATREEVAVLRPRIIYDHVLREYIIMAPMYWKKDRYGVPYWYDHIDRTGPMGGEEGIILEVENVPGVRVRIEDWNLVTYNTKNEVRVFRNAEDANRYGVAYKVQDYVNFDYGEFMWDYDFDSYDLWTYWTVSSGVDDVAVWHKFAHTWQTTGITEIEIGSGGASIKFSKSINKWFIPSRPNYWSI